MENSYLNETINLIEDNNANNLCLEHKENDLKREIYENNRLKGNLSTYKNNIFFKIVNILCTYFSKLILLFNQLSLTFNIPFI